MKLSLLSNVLLASMMVFAVSCGKDAKKKGRSYNYYNPYVGGGMTSTPTVVGQAAIDKLNAYIGGNDNNTVVGMINVYRSKFSCTRDDLLGIDWLPKVETCSEKYVLSQPYAMPGAQRGTNNPSLGTILTPPAGYSLGVVAQYGNSVIVVEHVIMGTANTIQYTIDLNRHSVVNPITKKDTAAKTAEYLVSPLI